MAFQSSLQVSLTQPYVPYAPSVYPSWFHQFNIMYQGVQMMQIFCMKFSLASSCLFLVLWSRYFSHPVFSNILGKCSALSVRDTASHQYKPRGMNACISVYFSHYVVRCVTARRRIWNGICIKHYPNLRCLGKLGNFNKSLNAFKCSN